jgi:hypothetical protein
MTHCNWRWPRIERVRRELDQELAQIAELRRRIAELEGR